MTTQESRQGVRKSVNVWATLRDTGISLLPRAGPDEMATDSRCQRDALSQQTVDLLIHHGQSILGALGGVGVQVLALKGGVGLKWRDVEEHGAQAV